MWSPLNLLWTSLWQRECAASRACGRKVTCRALLLQDLPARPSTRYMAQCAWDAGLIMPNVCWPVSVNNKQRILSAQETAGFNTGVTGRINSWKTKTPETKAPESKPQEAKIPETRSGKPAEAKTSETKSTKVAEMKKTESKTPEPKSLKPMTEKRPLDMKTTELKTSETKTPAHGKPTGGKPVSIFVIY